MVKKQIKKETKEKIKEKSKENDDSNKFLHIKLNTSIPDIMGRYCEVAGISEQDIGYHLGYILSARSDLNIPTIALTRAYFFAGMFHALKNKKEFTHHYISESEQKKIVSNTPIEEMKREERDKLSSYMG